MGGRAKRPSAIKADSKNKRIALQSREPVGEPVEDTESSTQEMMGDRERPAPHRRTSSQPKTPSKKTPERPSFADGMPEHSSSKLQVMIQEPSWIRHSAQPKIGPSSQTQVLPSMGNFQPPVLPQSGTSAKAPGPPLYFFSLNRPAGVAHVASAHLHQQNEVTHGQVPTHNKRPRASSDALPPVEKTVGPEYPSTSTVDVPRPSGRPIKLSTSPRNFPTPSQNEYLYDSETEGPVEETDKQAEDPDYTPSPSPFEADEGRRRPIKKNPKVCNPEAKAAAPQIGQKKETSEEEASQVTQLTTVEDPGYPDGSPSKRSLLPSLLSRPRYKQPVPNATPPDEQLEDSNKTPSPSPFEAARPQMEQATTPPGHLFKELPAPLRPRSPLSPLVPDQAQTPPGGINGQVNREESEDQAMADSSAENWAGIFHMSATEPDSNPENGSGTFRMPAMEPSMRQRNLDFHYKPAPLPNPKILPWWQRRDITNPAQKWILDEMEREAKDGNSQGLSNPALGSDAAFLDLMKPPPAPRQGGEAHSQPKQNQDHPLQREPGPSVLDAITNRMQLRIDGLGRREEGHTSEEDEEMRLSTAYLQTLKNFKVGRAIDDSKVREAAPVRQSAKFIPGCLALTQLPAAVAFPPQFPYQPFQDIIREDDGEACVFCNHESSFGIDDSCVWLPVEASQGYCSDCHEGCQQVFRLWGDIYKLPHGLSDEEKNRYKDLLEVSATTPLKEMGDALDFKSQHKMAMGQSERQDAIRDSSKVDTKDGTMDRREGRQAMSVRNVPRGGKLPTRRAASGSQRSQQMSNSGSNVVSPSRSESSTPSLPASNSNSISSSSAAVHTAWTGGVPSALPTMDGRSSDGPRRGIFSSAMPRADGEETASASASASATSMPVHFDLASRPASTSAQPTGPSGVPRYFTPAPPASFLQPPPFNSGPIFCRGCPWRLLDFTKAAICAPCRDTKHLICTHTHHTDFAVLATLPWVMSGQQPALGLGRTMDSGDWVKDGRYSNCMICTGVATRGCEGCPLRVCDQCEVTMSRMCKGKINGLLDFYNQSREHIRNDAFLLRNDNKGF